MQRRVLGDIESWNAKKVRKRIIPGKTLLVLDEIQESPRALTSLERHRIGKLTEDVPLYAVGRIVAETGSGRLI